MAGVIRYLILANFFLLVLALFNHLVLSRETRFKTNRFVFIFGVLLSLALPLFRFNWFPAGSYTIFSIPEIIISAKSRMTHYNLDEIQIFGTAPYIFPWIKFITILYLTGAALAGSILLWKIKRLQYWTRKYPMKWFQNLYITLIPGEWTPFSFNGIVYFPQPFNKTDQKTRMILNHENIHIKQKHSWDIILIEIVRIVFFYNPAVYTIKKQMQINHEYLADSSIVARDRKEYSQELIRSQLHVPQFQFIQQFNQTSFLKKRLLMLMKNKQKSASALKYLLLIPLTAAFFWFTACTDDSGPAQELRVLNNELNSDITGSGSLIDNYALSIMKGEDYTMNKWEKQIQAVALEMQKTGASEDEVLKLVKNRVKYLVSEVPEAIETSGILSIQNITLEELKKDIKSSSTHVITMADVSAPDSETFYIVEEMPEFDGGGLEEFRNWVQSQVVYPDIALENGISGTVYANFIVDKSGEINYVKIVRGIDPSLENEVIRVIKQSPKWKPGVQRGKNVNVSMAIPVKFQLK